MTIEDLQVLITANTDSLRKEIEKSKKDITSLQRNWKTYRLSDGRCC